MTKKDDLIAKAIDLGIELDSTETIADLEAKIAAKLAELDDEDDAPDESEEQPGVYVLADDSTLHRLPPGEYLVKQGFGVAEISDSRGDGSAAEPEPAVSRHRVNRGSRRRIERAVAALDTQIDAAIKEFDLQAYVTDEEGKRIGEWPAVTRLREVKAEINRMVNQLLAS